jgi:hypothetical protein
LLPGAILPSTKRDLSFSKMASCKFCELVFSTAAMHHSLVMQFVYKIENKPLEAINTALNTQNMD